MTSRLPVGRTYRLCGWCVERQDTPAKFEEVSGRDCFICRGALDRTEALGEVASREARRYQFKTFAVGVSMPSGVQEREDEVRADLKLKGKEGVKAQAARMVAKKVESKLRKKVDKMKPDLTMLVDFGTETATATTRPLHYYARYTKPSGISQRRTICGHCGGRGCDVCKGTGFEQSPSVEDLLRRKFSSLTGSERMTFTWIGSEDAQSRVFPPGRPFVVEIKSPVKRSLLKKFTTRGRGGRVAVSSGRVLPSKPLKLPAFKFRTRIVGTMAAAVPPVALAELRRSFRRTSVRFDRPNDRPTSKTVYRVSAKSRGKKILIDAELDGGLPVKRFVSGELVSPSVSEVLKTEVRCRSFDICGVKETGEFELAEVSRIKEKN